MRIVVTGRNGQVVRSLIERALTHGNVTAVALGRPELDLLDPGSIAPAIAAARPGDAFSPRRTNTLVNRTASGRLRGPCVRYGARQTVGEVL